MTTRYDATTIAVLSDTHGLLREEVVSLIQDCDLIIHGGDIGKKEILDQLNAIAPTVAVKGNVDKADWAETLPLSELIEVNQVFIYVLHDIKILDLDPAAAGIQVIISGHSHQPAITTRKGIIYFNPGSVGPRRFKLPISLGFLTITPSGPKAKLITIPC